jgi:hypothetical protein
MSDWTIRFYQALGVSIFLGLWALVAIVTGASVVVAGVATGVGVFVFFGVVLLIVPLTNRGRRGQQDEAAQREAADAALHGTRTQGRAARVTTVVLFAVLAIGALIDGLWWVFACALGFLALAVLVWRHPLVRGRT